MVFAAFITVGAGLFGLLTSHEQTNKEVVLTYDGQEVKVPYEKLGISIDATQTANQSATRGVFSLASLFQIGDIKGEQPKSTITIDKKLLTHAVVSIFPFLSVPEDAHASFFITSADQKMKPTFDVQKLVTQLEESDTDGSAIEIDVVPEDVEIKKKELAGKEIKIKLEGDSVPTLEWKISADTVLDKVKWEEFFKNKIVPKVDRPVKNASIKQFIDEGKALHVDVAGQAQDGISISVEKNIKAIRDAVLAGAGEAPLQPQLESSRIYNETDINLGNMELLAVGRSNFAGSPEGRAFNIQKGLSEKMNNIIVPPGAQFSFNDFVGPITAAAGWKKALGIFNGKDLKPTLGGGLCQVSTTVYRAALLAGLPITERKPHSLYVNYYKKFGEGLDATVFSTGPDLLFTNDTPSYIFIQSYADGNDAYVKIFGTSDGRKATLEGPYRSHDIPQEKGYKPPMNEIVWFRTVAWADGRQQEEMITSRYRALPRHPAR